MEKGNLSSGQNFEQCTWLCPLHEMRKGHMHNYILIHELYPVVWLDDQGFGRSIIEKLMTEIWGRGMWMDLSEWSKTVIIFVSHVSAHQWVTSAEEDFNNQVDRMTHSEDTTQPLSPATPVIAQWAHEQSGHGGRDGGYTWAQQHGLPLTKADMAMATAECPICQQQRPMLSPQ